MAEPMPNDGRAERAPSTARGRATLRRILAAAEREFGTRGYHAASVSGITRASGVAQGTFYIYFPGKEQILAELVRHVGRQLRAAMSAGAADAPDRLAAERAGLRAFLAFLGEHPHLYRIVQEAESVDETLYREYYLDIARGYAAGLQRAAEAGELRGGEGRVDYEVRAWALMGLGHFLGLRYGLWPGDGAAPDEAVIDAAMDFVAHGLAPARDSGSSLAEEAR